MHILIHPISRVDILKQYDHQSSEREAEGKLEDKSFPEHQRKD